jgi:hypothetical protein
MIDQRSSFSSFTAVEPGSCWPIKGIHKKPLQVHARGDVTIFAIINGIQKRAVIRDVLYVIKLREIFFNWDSNRHWRGGRI